MPINDPASRTERLVRQATATWTADFLSTMAVLRRSLDLDELDFLLQTGRQEEAFDLIRRASARLGVIDATTFVGAGRATSSWMERELGEVLMDFDMANPRAIQIMQQNRLRLIQQFSRQQIDAVRAALVRGITTGANPRDQARAFRNAIGLTDYQEGIVRNYERALRNLERDALQRRLRDRRFDRTVRGAIDTGTPLSESRITTMVDRYRERFRRYRAETIARTEALRSVHQGVRESFEQAVEGGTLQREQLTREWNTAADERVRDFANGAKTSHVTMHGQVVGFDEMFTSGAGNQAHHPGGFGIASEDVMCRCAIGTRIATLDELPGNLNIVTTQEL